MIATTEEPSYRLPNGSLIHQANEGETINIYRQIYERKIYFQHGVSLPERAVVVDAGANIGLFSRYVLEHYPTATVFAVEPGPPTFRLLHANISGFRMARLYHCGLGAEDTQKPFTFFPQLTCGSGFYDDAALQGIRSMRRNVALADENIVRKFPGAAGRERLFRFLDAQLAKETVMVPVWSLGTLIAKGGIDRIDLLKVDVEGSECEVIRGVRDEHWPLIRQVAMEVNDSPDKMPYLVETMTARGFTTAFEHCEPFNFTRKSMMYATRVAV